jgi:hypothetical protein
MTEQTETFTASMEGRLTECLGLARALFVVTKVLEVQIVLPAQKVTLVMPPGASLTVYLVQILLTTALWRVMGTSTA